MAQGPGNNNSGLIGVGMGVRAGVGVVLCTGMGFAVGDFGTWLRMGVMLGVFVGASAGWFMKSRRDRR